MLDWLEILDKLLNNQVGVTGIANEDDHHERAVTFAITPQYSVGQAIARAMREDGLKASSFKIPGEAGEVLVISGLVVSRDNLQSTDAPSPDQFPANWYTALEFTKVAARELRIENDQRRELGYVFVNLLMSLDT